MEDSSSDKVCSCSEISSSVFWDLNISSNCFLSLFKAARSTFPSENLIISAYVFLSPSKSNKAWSTAFPFSNLVLNLEVSDTISS